MRRNKTPYPILTICCVVVGTPDIITPENFGDDRIRGLGAAWGQILPFPIDFDHNNFDPYNTLALPCECVMVVAKKTNIIVNKLLTVSQNS